MPPPFAPRRFHAADVPKIAPPAFGFIRWLRRDASRRDRLECFLRFPRGRAVHQVPQPFARRRLRPRVLVLERPRASRPHATSLRRPQIQHPHRLQSRNISLLRARYRPPCTCSPGRVSFESIANLIGRAVFVIDDERLIPHGPTSSRSMRPRIDSRGFNAKLNSSSTRLGPTKRDLIVSPETLRSCGAVQAARPPCDRSPGYAPCGIPREKFRRKSPSPAAACASVPPMRDAMILP